MLKNCHNITTGAVKKLVTNLINKNNAVSHYRNLQQYLELVMKYIDFNTQKRKESTNESDKNLFEINEQCCIWENYGKYEKESKNKNCKK